MRGRPVGRELEKVRATLSVDNGLSLLPINDHSKEEAERLLKLYKAEPECFVAECAAMLHEDLEKLSDTENPDHAVSMIMTLGMVLDRLTNRDLMNYNPPSEEHQVKRSKRGLLVYDGNARTTGVQVVPYTNGKKVADVIAG